jgi:hypothetical protein
MRTVTGFLGGTRRRLGSPVWKIGLTKRRLGLLVLVGFLDYTADPSDPQAGP